jgi:phospholipase C
MGIRGVLTVMAVSPDADPAHHTATVLACNGMRDRRAQRAMLSSPVIPITPSEQIECVVFITKENHTYDTIFDHVPGANDDPSLKLEGLALVAGNLEGLRGLGEGSVAAH